MTTLFPGPVPQPPRGRPLVVGVDRPRGEDLALLERVNRDVTGLVALCAVPGTVFSDRFRFIGWQ